MKTFKNKKYSIEHTKQRLKERFNLYISDDDYNDMCNIVRKNGVIVSTDNNGTQTVYDIMFKNMAVRVVWDNFSGYIKTVFDKKSQRIK